MRVLLGCSLGGEGHLAPLTAVGRAIQRAGSEVLLVVPPAMAASAGRTGLSYRVGDEPPRPFVEEIWERVRVGPVGPVGAVAGLIDRELFADRCTQAMLPAVRALREAWRPALVVREPCEYATAIAAYERGIAQAQVGISLASLESGVRKMVAPIIDRFAPGVAAAIGAAPYLSSFPASLDPSDWPDTRRFRPPRATTEPENEWWWGAGPPLVYVTFGSVLGHLPEAAATYRCALDAVAGLPVRALLTVGRATDVASLGSVPENARVEQWVTQDAVLRRAALVVCHGGSGTTFGALAAGVPIVVCPLFADQSHNGQAVQDAGAGVVLAGGHKAAGGLRGLGPDDVTALRERIEDVLHEPRYRDAARRIEAEMSSMPTVDQLVRELV